MILISDNNTLARYCESAKQSSHIAVDTEFIRYNTYYPQLSLIQIASADAIFAIDMKAEGLDYSLLSDLLKNKNIVKVLHAAKQDLEVIYNQLQVLPNPIFDTQIAALFDGFSTCISYELLVRHYLGVEICKNMQFSNWLKRPLTKSQLDYALNDVIYLYQVFPIMTKSLIESSRLKWVNEECSNLQTNTAFYPTYEQLLDKLFNHLTNKVNIKLQLRLAVKIIKIREKEAAKLNVCRDFIISDQGIAQMINIYCKYADQKIINSSDTEKSILDEQNKQINNNRSIRYNFRKLLSFNDDLTDKMIVELKNSLTKSEEKVIQNVINNRNLKQSIKNKNQLYYIFKALLQSISHQSSIQESLIASLDDILLLSYNMPSRVDQGWRYDLFGQYVEKLASGKIALSLHDNMIKIV